MTATSMIRKGRHGTKMEMRRAMVETEVVLPDGRRSGAKRRMPLQLTPCPRMLKMTPIRRLIRRAGGKVRR